MMHDKQPALLLIEDEQMNTPMHWAASVDHLEGVRFLYEINPDSVLQRNEEGFYPFHLASANGRVRVMGEFFEKENMPHPTELLNKKGQNILHVAAKKGKSDTVRRILKASNIDTLINEMDDDGNTPLHLAALYGRHLAAAILVWDGQANQDIINFHGQTAYSIAKQKSAEINPEFFGNDDDADQLRVDNYKTTDKNMKDSGSKPNAYNMMMTLTVLFQHQLSRSGPTSFQSLLKFTGNTSNQRSVKKNDVNNRINTFIVVAALIAGASFASSVQMGSSSFSDSERSTTSTSILRSRVLAPKYFTAFNTIAMYTSITAALILCLALTVDPVLASINIWFASLLIVIALYASCNAFSDSTLMLKDRGQGFIVAMTVIQCFLLIPLALLSPNLLRLKKPMILHNYRNHLWFWYFLDWIWSSISPLLCSLPPCKSPNE